MRRATLRDRLRYRFDALMSRGTVTLIVCLWLASISLILVASAVVVAGGLYSAPPGAPPATFTTVLWMCLMRTLDGGTMAQDTGGWGFLVTMLAVTTGGILFSGMLIGILTAGIDLRIQEMRKGRSFVVERGHVVVLGWSEQIVIVVRELLRANEHRRNFRVVVLAPRDKVAMEDQLRRRLEHRDGFKVVCRTGDPTDLNDVQITNAEAARAVIVIPAEVDEERTVQMVMALTTGTRAGVRHIVTEASRPETRRLLDLVAPGQVQAIAAQDLVARLAAQTCRQPGLAAVYHDLLDFAGNEIYIGHAADVRGRPFGEILLAFADAIPIGLLRAGDLLLLNPPMTTRIADGDRLIAIANGPTDIRFTGVPRMTDPSVIASRWSHVPRERRPERSLLIGWNSWSALFLSELGGLVPPGSTAVVLADGAPPESELHALVAHRGNLKVERSAVGSVDRAALEAAGVCSFDHVLVVADRARIPPDLADARSLATLLDLRDVAARGSRRFSLTCEILVEKNREVLKAAGVDDLISSAQVASLMMTQVVQNRGISRVFEALFDPAGAEFHLKPVEKYVSLETEIDFADVILAAREHGEIAVGHRLAENRGGMVLNPAKQARMSYTAGDRLIVLAED